MKQCSKCKRTLPLTEFCKGNDKDCLRYKCKECINIQSKEYYQKNKERYKIYNKGYYEKNKEHVKIQAKIYRENNKDKILVRGKEHYKKNKEKYKEYYREYRRKYPERVKAHQAVQYLPVGNDCEICGSTRYLCKHHDDYSKPLEYRTVCVSCNVRLG